MRVFAIEMIRDDAKLDEVRADCKSAASDCADDMTDASGSNGSISSPSAASACRPSLTCCHPRGWSISMSLTSTRSAKWEPARREIFDGVYESSSVTSTKMDTC